MITKGRQSMKRWRQGLAAVFAVILMISSLPLGQLTVLADNRWVFTEKVPSGKTGKNMTVSFTVKNSSGHDIKKLGIGFDTSGVDIGDEDEDDLIYGYAFPFEMTQSSKQSIKSLGSLGAGKTRTVTLSGKVRRDLSDGYYNVPIAVYEQVSDEDDGGWYQHASENIRVWISKSTGSTDEEDDETKTYDFVLGENQSTPYGIYPNVLDFSMNLRNNSPATVYNVKVSMVMDPDSTKFPFDINEANYDRRFEQIGKDETVPLPYSFAIRSDVYSGYYPINMKISYSKSSTGEELETYETSFFVRVTNKDKEDDRGDFNEHDRTRARIIIDGFTTAPETIIAGDEFELVLMIKNASSNITATNLLFSLESEKVSDSAVFTTESGSSSIAMDSLGPGSTRELRMRLLSKPSVDQRSYGLTVKAKFDSPEYKNAEENMQIDIPVKQIPRLNTGTFEVMPDSIKVGEESNIMFGINNTGRVILYNVMVSFEADSIQYTDTYVGNIKPGETGNVDCMLTGLAATVDNGKIKVLISHEDENGNVATEEKELRLYVVEDVMEYDDMEAGNFDDVLMEEPSFFAAHQSIIILAAAAVAVLAAILISLKIRKKKQKALEEDEDEDDEFS